LVDEHFGLPFPQLQEGQSMYAEHRWRLLGRLLSRTHSVEHLSDEPEPINLIIMPSGTESQ
jgi:hypothetical protein